MLSTLSPIRARKSMISSGPTPNFFHAIHVEAATGHGADQRNVPVDQLRHVLVAGGNHHRAVSARCCAPGCRSRRRPRPSTHSSGRPRARTLACSGSTWTRRRHRRPVGLYSANSSSRKVGPLASKTTANGLSGYCLRRLSSARPSPHRWLAGRGGQRRQGMEGAVQVRGTVHQDEGRLAHEGNQPRRPGRENEPWTIR